MIYINQLTMSINTVHQQMTTPKIFIVSPLRVAEYLATAGRERQ